MLISELAGGFFYHLSDCQFVCNFLRVVSVYSCVFSNISNQQYQQHKALSVTPVALCGQCSYLSCNWWHRRRVCGARQRLGQLEHSSRLHQKGETHSPHKPRLSASWCVMSSHLSHTAKLMFFSWKLKPSQIYLLIYNEVMWHFIHNQMLKCFVCVKHLRKKRCETLELALA